jgi:CspA family cold shock protein
MFLYSSLNSPNDPVAGVAFGPSGTAAIGCGKSHLAGKATTFFSTLSSWKAEIFQSDAEAKGVAFVKEKGTVKWFNGAKGYGFIQRSTGEDVFVHFSAIQENGYRTLNEGETVEYELMKGPKGFLAANVLRGSAAN